MLDRAIDPATEEGRTILRRVAIGLPTLGSDASFALWGERSPEKAFAIKTLDVGMGAVSLLASSDLAPISAFTQLNRSEGTV